MGQAPVRRDSSKELSPPTDPSSAGSGARVIRVVNVAEGLAIIGLKALLRLKISTLEGEPVREILAGARLRELEGQLGYNYELYSFRVRCECVEAEGERFKTWCRDLSQYLKPGTINFEALELERLFRELPQVDPARLKQWVDRLLELDAEMSMVDRKLARLLGELSESERVEDRKETLCLETLLTTKDGSRMLPLPSYAFLCAQRLEQLYNVKKWLGLLYINVDGRWLGEPESIDTLQSIMKRSFERLGLHEFNWKYSTFEREVLKVLYAGAPRAEPVRGVRAGDYVIVWGEDSYELRRYNGDFVVHDINAKVRLELLDKAKAKGYNARELAESEAPELTGILKSWVGDPYWLTLLELIGYTTMAFQYPFNKAFMLIGSGSNGKSTFLRMLKDILGRHNVTSIPLQAFSSLDYRFLWSGLVGKLANIFADIPKTPLKYTGVFKILTGEDCINIDRKGKEPIQCYTNYAKLIFSANELPETGDTTRAFFRRWILVEFPNTFPDDPTWYDRNIRPELRDTALTVGLEAMREVLERRAFTGETYVRDRWLEESDPVYRFIRALERLNLARRDPKGRVEDRTLYKLYITWADLEGVEPLDKKVFTERLAKYGVLKHKKHYVGITLLERPDIVEDKLKATYEEEGLEAYREE